MNEAEYLTFLEGAPVALAVERRFHIAGLSAQGQLAFGCGVARSVGQHLAALTPARKAILISDRVLADLGVSGLVASWLEAAGFQVETFLDVEPEPSLETAEAAAVAARRIGAGAVVGLGGGSVLDVAKLVALSVGTGQSVDALTVPGGLRPDMTMTPALLMPTTAGTGSETSVFAVVTAGTTKRALASPVLIPHAAILDPLLTFSMPRRVTAMTGLDALTHAIEAMMHTAATPMCFALSSGAIRLIGNALRQACAAPHDHSARYDMLIGSAMAMMSFSQSGGLWAHSVSYVLGKHKAVPHGLGCALGLPALIRFNADACPEVVREIAHQLGAADAADGVERLMRDIGLPTSLREIGIAEDDLPDYAAEMLSLYPRPANPRNMDLLEAGGYWQSMFSDRVNT